MSDDEARRREEIAQLRAAAGATTPEAYRVRPVDPPSGDPMNKARESYTSLFGAMGGNKSIRDGIATALVLGANGIAYVVLILMLHLAQCSWWYEPGMYSDPETQHTSGR